MVVLRQAPKILSQAQQYMSLQQSQLRVECLVRSTSEERHQFTWLRKDKIIDVSSAPLTDAAASDYYGLVDERSPDHLFQRSTLIINKATMEDFGDYQCRVDNSLGSDQLTIQLQPISPTTIVPLIVICLILGSIILIVSIVVLMLLCTPTIDAINSRSINRSAGGHNNNNNSGTNATSAVSDIKLMNNSNNDHQQQQQQQQVVKRKSFLITRLIKGSGKGGNKTNQGRHQGKLHHTIISPPHQMVHQASGEADLNEIFKQQQTSPGGSIVKNGLSDSGELDANGQSDQKSFSLIQKNLEKTLQLQAPGMRNNGTINGGQEMFLSDSFKNQQAVNRASENGSKVDNNMNGNNNNTNQTSASNNNNNNNNNLGKLFSRLIKFNQTSLSGASLGGARNGSQKSIPLSRRATTHVNDNNNDTKTITNTNNGGKQQVANNELGSSTSCANLIDNSNSSSNNNNNNNNNNNHKINGVTTTSNSSTSGNSSSGSSSYSGTGDRDSHLGRTEVCMIDSNGQYVMSSTSNDNNYRHHRHLSSTNNHDNNNLGVDSSSQYNMGVALLNNGYNGQQQQQQQQPPSATSYWQQQPNGSGGSYSAVSLGHMMEMDLQQQQQQQYYQRPNSLLMMTNRQSDYSRPTINHMVDQSSAPINGNAQIYINQLYNKQQPQPDIDLTLSAAAAAAAAATTTAGNQHHQYQSYNLYSNNAAAATGATTLLHDQQQQQQHQQGNNNQPALYQAAVAGFQSNDTSTTNNANCLATTTYGSAYDVMMQQQQQYQQQANSGPPLVVTSGSAGDAFFESNYGTLISQSSAYRTLGYSKPTPPPPLAQLSQPSLTNHNHLDNQYQVNISNRPTTTINNNDSFANSLLQINNNTTTPRSQQLQLSSTSTISMLGLDETNHPNSIMLTNDDVFVANINNNNNTDNLLSNNIKQHVAARQKSLSHNGSASLSSNGSNSSNNNSDNNVSNDNLYNNDSNNNNNNNSRSYSGLNSMPTMMNQPRIFQHLPVTTTTPISAFGKINTGNNDINLTSDSIKGHLPLATHV